jgi:hypothetical protein
MQAQIIVVMSSCAIGSNRKIFGGIADRCGNPDKIAVDSPDWRNGNPNFTGTVFTLARPDRCGRIMKEK